MTYEGCGHRMCIRHKIKQEDYVTATEEAERRLRAGWSQERCPQCLRFTRWFTPSETRKKKGQRA